MQHGRESVAVAARQVYLQRYQLGVFASASYLRGHARPKRVADLAQHECVLFRGGNGTSEWRLTGPRGEESVIVRGPVNADEMSFVQRAVTAGIGLALLPLTAVRLAAQRGSPLPVRLLPEYSVAGGDLSVVMPSLRFQPASVIVFREFLIRELAVLWHSA